MRANSAKERVIIINSIENNIDVKNWVIEGINIWPVVRLYLVSQLTSDKKRLKSLFFKKSMLFIGKAIKILWYNLVYFLKHGLKENKYDVIFLGYTVYKKYRSNTGWVDVFLHPIVDLLKKMNYTFMYYEYIGDNHLKFPGHVPAQIIDLCIIKNLVLAKFHQHKIDMCNSISYINLIEKHLKEKHNIELQISYKFIRKRVSQILANYHFFINIIDRYKPKLFFTTSYTSWGFSLSLACYNSGIKCVDIQHGVQGKYSAKYGSWLNAPKEGYNILPQVFAVWDEHESKAIQKWSLNTIHRTFIYGNMTMKLFPNDSKAFYLSSHDKINVLITLQKTRDITELVAQLLTCHNDKIYWWIRTHPSMTSEEIKFVKSFLRKLNTNNFNLKEASESNLFTLLYYMDMHLTEYSSVTLEATWFNVPTILIHKTGFDIYQNEIIAGRAFYINEVNRIIEKIGEVGQKSNTQKIEYQNKHEVNLIRYIKSYL